MKQSVCWFSPYSCLFSKTVHKDGLQIDDREVQGVHGGDIYRNKVEIDFSVNVNPLGMPESVRAALTSAVAQCECYPDIRAERLINAISNMTGADTEELLCGNGASELFPAIARAVMPGKILIPVPSFYGYERAAEGLAGVEYYKMREADGFALTENFLDCLTQEVGLVFLANPNNPVGNCLGAGLLERILCRCRELGIAVVLDECFIEFVEDGEKRSFLRRVREFPNLIVVRAFTKIFAMPGVRLGYLVCGNPGLRGKIEKQLSEWNLSVFAQAAGVAAAGEREYREKSAAIVKAGREYLTAELQKLGMRVYPSDANFLFLHTELPLREELLRRGILIRDCRDFKGLGEGYYRVAVKRREQNDRLLEAVMRVVQTSEAERYMEQIQSLRPEEIEKKSFSIIEEELKNRGISLPAERADIVKRVIHTTADFDYTDTLVFSDKAVETARNLILQGADIVTDTNMALSGINKRVLARFGGSAHCFMAEEEVAREAKERGVTRAAVSMEFASKMKKPLIFAIGNAPTALIRLYEMMEKGEYTPAFIIGVPVGFVNVEAAKELIAGSQVPHIVARGRKGGSNVAAAICNALLYGLGR